ncbi:MAG: peptide/nickel transport system permease protein [Frankiaceae bacterium]|jgi:peptide/nickel transport system permease protein|nr:peptide/nickel transport system permease protein [Frankiaceae bacterium]MDQ1727516.1 peptide/nickel transport system permease protein [Frankiaceae bacterium]
MTRFLLRRLGFGVVVVWLVATAVFGLFFFGSAASTAAALCGPRCTPDQLAQVRVRFGLDSPVAAQYAHFLARIAHLDLGRSSRLDVPVLTRIASSLAPTASLVVGAAVLWMLAGVGAGVAAARRPGSWRDRTVTVAALTTLSVPTFVVGMLLVYAFYLMPRKLGFVGLPATGYVPLTGSKGSPGQWLSHLVLPWCSLAIVSAGVYARLTRAAVLSALGEDFVRTATAKGISARRVAFRHALPAGAPGILTIFGVDVGTLLGGAVVIEQLFNLHGLGQEAIDALQAGDRPMIMGLVLFGTLAIVVMSLVVDVLHARLDPRVTLG